MQKLSIQNDSFKEILEFAETPDLGGHKHQQQHIAAGPPHHKGHSVIPFQIEHARQAEKTGRTHPVARNRRSDADPPGIYAAHAIIGRRAGAVAQP